ncbi:MAG: hypothetical protein ACRD4P_15335 [Bryobacteraceae bacterium]
MCPLAQPVEELEFFPRRRQALPLFGQSVFPYALLIGQSAGLSPGVIVNLRDQGELRRRERTRIRHPAAFLQNRLLKRLLQAVNLIQSGVQLLQARFFGLKLLLLPAARGL